MRKIFSILILSLITQVAYSQSSNDALLISQNSINGSARMSAMGGAFTALGGDLSAMQLNPASGAIFLKNQAGLSYSFSKTSNTSSFYNGGGNSDKNYNNLNQIGIVFVTDNNDASSSIVKYALGFNYNRTKNYNDNLSFSGNNNTLFDDSKGEGIYYNGDLMYDGYSSIATSLVLSSNGINPNELQGLEYLAYDTYLTDINDPDSPYYDDRYPTFTDDFPVYVMSAIPNNLKQDYTMNRSGFSGQYNFSASMDVNNKLYLGVSYDRSTFETSTEIRLKETGFEKKSEVQQITYESKVNTFGTGDGFSIGGIYKANNLIRIGVSFHSPTWYKMNDEYSYKLSIINKTENNESASTETFYSDYEIKTPGKMDAGIAFIFGKYGIISTDYEFINYSSMNLGPNDYFEYENEDIKNLMTSTHNISIGTEWKISFISLRAGYNYLQTPYKNNEWQEDTQRYSLGVGINFIAWSLDVSYQNSLTNYDYYIYDTDLVNAANINRTQGSVVASLKFTL